MRSKWKGAYCAPRLRNEWKQNIEIYERSSTILPEFVGTTVKIHTGNDWKSLEIKDIHVGFKFGEFGISKKSARYKTKSK